jgi:hypothetical protein
VVGYAATVTVRRLRPAQADAAASTVASVSESEQQFSKEARNTWRMPPLEELPAPQLTLSKRVWMGVLRGYLIVAVALVVVKVVQMTLLH